MQRKPRKRNGLGSRALPPPPVSQRRGQRLGSKVPHPQSILTSRVPTIDLPLPDTLEWGVWIPCASSRAAEELRGCVRVLSEWFGEASLDVSGAVVGVRRR